MTTLELDVGISKMASWSSRTTATSIPTSPAMQRAKFLSERGPVIATVTFAELQRYDVGRIKPGSNYAKAFATQQGTDGERVPALAALFDLVVNAAPTYASTLKPKSLLPLRQRRRRPSLCPGADRRDPQGGDSAVAPPSSRSTGGRRRLRRRKPRRSSPFTSPPAGAGDR